jgi:hypothetical protein
MSIFTRPVSEAYSPEAPHRIFDVEPSEHYQAWGYTLGYEVNEHGNDVPHWGNTATIRIHKRGMTPPKYVTKPDADRCLTIDVAAGRGMLLRALTSGATEVIQLNEDDRVGIKTGEAYSLVNIDERDFILRCVAIPAFQPGDDIELTKSELPSYRLRQSEATACVYATTEGKQKRVSLPAKFYDLVGQAAADQLNP